MRVAIGWRRWIVVLAALSVALLGGAIAQAQSDPTHRFFGFYGDVTIDDNPLEPGALIVATIGEEEIGRATVNQAGAWILDVDPSHFEAGSCSLTFVVDGLRSDQEWDTCPLRVRLALYSDGQERESSGSPDAVADSGEQDDPASNESAIQADQAAAEGEEPSGDQMADDEAADSEEQEREIVRPAAPRTGTGGLFATEDSTNWPRAAAITALLIFGIAIMALLIGRGTDSTT
ncbi:MAG: hypothetical protein OXS30_05260 [Chloroflexota bacterium]|nr:hypothetical protein [Chloroflexota bacterium]